MMQYLSPRCVIDTSGGRDDNWRRAAAKALPAQSVARGWIRPTTRRPFYRAYRALAVNRHSNIDELTYGAGDARSLHWDDGTNARLLF
jgi:hypothetical protein